MEFSAAAQGLDRGRGRLVQGLAHGGLTRDVIDAILARHTLVRYPKGAQIFAPGAPADVIFVVLGGLVKIYCAERAHERVLITLAGPGDIIGYADFSDPRGGRSQLFEAVAQSGAAIAIITREHLLRVLRGLDSSALLALGEEVNAMWAAALHRCARFLGMSLRARLGAVFAELAERFGVADARGVLLPLGLGQVGLAEMIGGSRPMVSKLLIELTRDGLIARHGRQYIVRGAAAKPEAARLRLGELADFRRKRSAPYPAETGDRRNAAAGNHA